MGNFPFSQDLCVYLEGFHVVQNIPAPFRYRTTAGIIIQDYKNSPNTSQKSYGK